MGICVRCSRVLPTRFRPGPAWVHEVKWDGMRLLADVQDGRLSLTSRTGRDVTAAFPELEPLAAAYEDMLLDGEVVALDGGLPSFHALAERMHVTDRRRAERLAATRPVTFIVFDLLRLFGSDLTGQPWSSRRELLERLDLAGPHWQVPPVYDDGEGLFEATLERGLEGVVSKRRSTPVCRGPPIRRLAQARRTAATVSAVVGGWRPEVGLGGAARRAPRRAARRGRAVAVSPAGSAPGWPARRGRACAGGWPRCAGASRPSPTRCPRSTPPAPSGSSRGSSSRCGPSGPPRAAGCASRHTSGSATTSPPPTSSRSTVAEQPAVTRVDVAGRTLEVSSLDKVMYPATETTKGEILDYYARVAPVLLPRLAARPVTRVRWPHGVEDVGFFEKNLPSGAPSWLPRVQVDDVTYPLVEDLAHLVYLVNLNSLELHVPQWPSTPTVDADTPTGSSSTSTRARRPGCASAPGSPSSSGSGSRRSAWSCPRSPRGARGCSCMPRSPATSPPTRSATSSSSSPRS